MNPRDPFPGVYRHHKGGLYSVLMLADDSTNKRAGLQVVVYVSLTTGQVHARARDEWIELVMWPDGFHRPRFELASEPA